jgi:hypothetical protein
MSILNIFKREKMIYFVDEIVLIDIKTDKNGLITETELPAEKAKIFEYNRLIIDANGKEVLAEAKIDLNANSTVKSGWKIKLKKKLKQAYELPDKKFAIKKIQHISGFSQHFIRIFI